MSIRFKSGWRLLVAASLFAAGHSVAKASVVDQQIDALLAKARQESVAGQLTTPPGDNLLETIDTIIKLAEHASPDMLPKLAELTRLIDGASTRVTDVTPTAAPEVRPAPPVASKPLGAQVDTASDQKWALMFKRGQDAQRLGDISGARRFYEAAASHGHALAALNLAKLYDPAVLRQMNILGGIADDPALAEKWYREATRLGNPDAHVLLQSLVSR